MRLAVVVSFLNEGDYLPIFLASLAAQERPPDVLLLINDGSTDDSGNLAEAFAAEHPNARVIHREPRPPESDRLATAAELRAFRWGVEQLSEGWDIVTKLDADLDLSPDLFATIVARLEAEPRLGIAGSYLSQYRLSGTKVRESHPADHVRGPNKFYRRACFEQIEPLPEILGWDTIDDILARMHGWRTQSVELASGDPVHLRPTGSHDGRLRAYRRWGLCAYAWGADPLYATAGAAYRMRERPWVLAGLSYLAGYIGAALRRAPRAQPDVIAFSRREQRRRLRQVLRLHRT